MRFEDSADKARKALEKAQNSTCADYGCDGLNLLGSPCAGQCNRLWHIESCRRRLVRVVGDGERDRPA